MPIYPSNKKRFRREPLTPQEVRYYITVGQAIQAQRIACGFTQARLAALLGITRTSVVNYEAGTIRIPLHRAHLAATILRMPLEDLLPSVSSLKTRLRLPLGVIREGGAA